MAQYKEGDIADGPNGSSLVFRGGRWVPMGRGANIPGGIVVPKAEDPYKARDEQRKDEDQGLQRDSAARSAVSDAISNPQTLRKEFSQLPEVKEYRIASQQAAAALKTAPNPQGDIALTYAFAKAMDPGSVVREQEQGVLVNSQPVFQSLLQRAKKEFGLSAEGNFTPEARAAIRQEILRNLATREPLYDARRAELAQIAQANGLDAEQIVGKSDTDIFAPVFRSYAEKNGDPDGVVFELIGGPPIARPQGAPSMPRAAGFGATEGAVPIPPELQAAHSKYITENWGNIDPQDYAAFRINLDRQFGFGSNPEAYSASAEDLNKAATQGVVPGGVVVPSITKELSGFDQFRNNLLSDDLGIGAGVASGLNAAGFGIPSLFLKEQSQALREANPWSTVAGELIGGVVGTGYAGNILKGAAGVTGSTGAKAALTNPLTADIAYGTLYGATQADDPLYGAAGGALSALAGNKIGSAVGRAFPGLTGAGKAVAEADAMVPTSQQLRDQASQLYDRAEAIGGVIQPPETLALADTTSGILSREGRLGPGGRLTEVQKKVGEAYNLIQDYAGEPMTPTQVQTIRSVISDGLSSQEPSEQRVAGMVLDNFDNWTDAVEPELAAGLRDARAVASRYLQGDKIAEAGDLADVRAGQFSDSGAANAVRTDFRQLDRKIVKGQERFTPAVEAAIRDVARGTPVSNLFRNVGRFAPTGATSAIPTLLATGGGSVAAGIPGGIAGLALGGAAFGARQIGQRLTNRAAQVAENLAYGGAEYEAALKEALDQAAIKGGHIGGVLGTNLMTNVSRLLPNYAGAR